jgi:hypothetical protein
VPQTQEIELGPSPGPGEGRSRRGDHGLRRLITFPNVVAVVLFVITATWATALWKLTKDHVDTDLAQRVSVVEEQIKGRLSREEYDRDLRWMKEAIERIDRRTETLLIDRRLPRSGG